MSASTVFYHKYPPKPRGNQSFASVSTNPSTNHMNSSLATSSMGAGGGGHMGSSSFGAVPPPATPTYMSTPIKVTSSSLESLMYALAHTVEFQRTLNAHVAPADVYCDSLGGIYYSACTVHQDSLIKSLPPAVEKAKAFRDNTGSGALAGCLFSMKIKVVKVEKKSGLSSWFSGDQKVPVEEWEFLIQKHEHDTVTRSKASFASQPDTPSTENKFNISEDRLTFCNDPRQVRDALMFVINKSFDAIDEGYSTDFSTADGLAFEIVVEERQGI